MTDIITDRKLPDYLLPPYGGEDTVPENLNIVNPYLREINDFDLERSKVGILSANVDTLLNEPGNGYYGYYSDNSRWGTSETIRAIKEVGNIWSKRGSRPRIGIGDISLRGGGPISGHASHQKGVDIDIIPVRNDGREDGVTWQDSNYSRKLTQELIDLFYANSTVAVELIFFNDGATEGTSPWPNHDNHLHVRLFVPGSGPNTPILLLEGNKNPAVRELQRRLNFWIETIPGGLSKLDLDADFGNLTKTAVLEFQRIKGLATDGKVGQNTWQALPMS
jgi:Putative peptidoglycan binding domain/Penicillin-insensitive murein endopeptidase